MRLSLSLFLLTMGLMGQTLGPTALLHGQLIECRSPGDSGELTVRTGSGLEFRFSFDAKTYFEKRDEHVTYAGLDNGDWLEIVSDQIPGDPLRYARTVHVIDRRLAARSARMVTAHRWKNDMLEDLFPRGNVTFAGVVGHVSGGRLLLRTHTGGEQTILLRQDTRFLSGGAQVDVTSLRPSTRVFVRAGKNLDDQLEAYQVVWGDILEPR
ncbi:MAG: hypothetical protein U0Q18_27215 [Bryobacteraceae bacterium]